MKVGDAVRHIEQTGCYDVGIVVGHAYPHGRVPESPGGAWWPASFEVLWCEGVVHEVYEDQLEVISESR